MLVPEKYPIMTARTNMNIFNEDVDDIDCKNGTGMKSQCTKQIPS